VGGGRHGEWRVAAAEQDDVGGAMAVPFPLRRSSWRYNTPPKEDIVKYALLIYSVPGAFESLSADEQEAIYGEYMAISELPGIYGGEQLQPVHTATTIRNGNGQTLVTDGPFAEAKEAFGGFYLLEADNLDLAIEVASRIPAVRTGGGVEVRAVVER
jgi:hypothetical protein